MMRISGVRLISTTLSSHVWNIKDN